MDTPTVIDLTIKDATLSEALLSLDKLSGKTTKLLGPYDPTERFTIQFEQIDAIFAFKTILKNYDYIISTDGPARSVFLYGLSSRNPLQSNLVIKNHADTNDGFVEGPELIYHPDESQLVETPGELSYLGDTGIIELVYHPKTLYEPETHPSLEYNDYGILEPIPQPTVALSSQNGEISLLRETGIVEFVSYPDELNDTEDQTYTFHYLDNGILEPILNPADLKSD